MEVLDAIYHRRAVRAYQPEPIDEASMRHVVEAATQAPSAIDAQPWWFLVVRGRARLQRIAAECKAHLLRTLQPDSPLAHLRSRLEDESFDIFYGAPALAVVYAVSGEQQSAEDCAMAAQNLMLAAYAQGIGSCCIGLARPWLGLAASKAELGVPQAYVPVVPVVLGRPAFDPAPPGRRPPQIHWLGGDDGAAA